MNNKYFKLLLLWLLIGASFASITPVLAKNLVISDSTTLKSTLKFKDNRPNRPIFKSTVPSDFESFMFKMTSLKSDLSTNKSLLLVKPSSKNLNNLSLEPLKPIDNVRIYPNPVTDQLTLSYTLKKESFVTVKVLDVLGNEVLTLLSKRVSAGDQSNTFILESKINSGFYFVRVIAGSDSIIKRISVL